MITQDQSELDFRKSMNSVCLKMYLFTTEIYRSDMGILKKYMKIQTCGQILLHATNIITIAKKKKKI